MALKQFKFKGKTIAELKQMSLKDFAQLVPARQRRTLLRGFTPAQKILLENIKKAIKTGSKKPVKTHCRDCIIIPEMVGVLMGIHKGKEFITIEITDEMIGHYLGELALTRKRVEHSAPGVGATKSSSAISVR